MNTITKKKYKVDISEIEDEALNQAFGENRVKVNEEGLSPQALEAKQCVVAAQVAAKLFVRQALASLGTVTTDDRREVEQIAVDAIAKGGDCIDYLAQYCEEVPHENN
jgi:hypothetical protein